MTTILQTVADILLVVFLLLLVLGALLFLCSEYIFPDNQQAQPVIEFKTQEQEKPLIEL